ncbi:MAG TPA: hypothetical protein VN621_03930 [Arthrobacter sp.]|nr:hypothetical protein [Arthrobacter sp.]
MGEPAQGENDRLVEGGAQHGVHAAEVAAPFDYAADGVLFAAILMPAGFFLSVVGRNPEKPNGFVVLLWVGAVLLALSLVAGGLGLILAA